ncbi:FTR1 family iron permease [Aestuariivirga litoralis]|uniref:FTR1 family iron permease n=1 Tax=Aestuariivirga litoralis TaxID=2650924 RepID=UPI0018C6BAE5|nr:FTR1 family protein [Aestuariivirga litoralis]MBG1231684.1 iron permease [Aestuariivirga litoralis]
MLGALIIVFREVFEAGLAIGIVAAAVGGAQRAGRYIWLGIAAGVVGSLIVAVFAGQIANLFGGYGQEMLNATILILAVFMLAWHTWWMARQGRNLAAELRELGQMAASGSRPMMAIAIVVATAVLREGSEVVLFLYGASAESGATAIQSLTGGLLGLALGACVSLITYYGIVQIPMRWIFAATTGLITLLAAGMAAQAARFLQAGGAVESLTTEMWDWSAFLPDSNLLGTFLKALMGYSDRPTALMVLAFVATLIAFTLISRLSSPKPRVQAA